MEIIYKNVLNVFYHNIVPAVGHTTEGEMKTERSFLQGASLNINRPAHLLSLLESVN